MASIKVQVSSNEKEWLEYMAKLYNISLSDLVLKYSFDQLEDAYDLHVGKISHKKYLEDDMQTVSMSEVKNEFVKKA
ncbi:type II toxin-antitoxin system RelB family antitoxin [Companilactobacillus ginsenosidimutans]|uniref:Antitoxin n=1 Tax=Companilactobacillus ginsenosidimutans TaxID=1007676 RepID=A0A0H4QGR3_9LACO|nr:DUF6290 family protein [Companilactobacillus ginsenosidimutans]AKP67599.1 antitoxin [Companilactobacillus ginsenosidimutans]